MRGGEHMEAIKQAIIEMLNSATEEELKIIYLFAAHMMK